MRNFSGSYFIGDDLDFFSVLVFFGLFVVIIIVSNIDFLRLFLLKYIFVE